MVFWYLLFLLAVLGLLAALVISACRWTDEIVIHNKTIDQLQEQNKKLNKELQNAQTLKLQKEQVEATVAVQPKPQPVQSQIPVGSENLIGKVRAAFLPFGQSENAVTVAMCESANLDPAVVYGPKTGSAGERGIMQIHPVHAKSMTQYGFTWDDMFNPDKNLAYAVILFKSVGLKWSPTWTCATNHGIY